MNGPLFSTSILASYNNNQQLSQIKLQFSVTFRFGEELRERRDMSGLVCGPEVVLERGKLGVEKNKTATKIYQVVYVCKHESHMSFWQHPKTQLKLIDLLSLPVEIKADNDACGAYCYLLSISSMVY